jgi:hypothetical protein
MSFSSKAGAWISGALISLMAFAAAARAEVLLNSLDSPNTGSLGGFVFSGPMDASFATGASAFRATDIALLLDRDGLDTMTMPGDTFTVSLEGGVPLADVTFLGPNLGLNIFGGSLLGSVTLPLSDLSTSLTVEHFAQFAGVTLQPNSFYWIDFNASEASSEFEGDPVAWGITTDNSGIGVAAGYNSSSDTDFMFYPNNNIAVGGLPAFQMEVSGTAVPESSTWVLMLAGFGGVAFIGYYRCRAALALNPQPAPTARSSYVFWRGWIMSSGRTHSSKSLPVTNPSASAASRRLMSSRWALIAI